MMIENLQTARLILKPLGVEDEHRITAFYERNKTHLGPWETVEDWLGPDAEIGQALVRWTNEHELRTSLRFALVLREHPDDDIIGLCNFSQVFYGYLRACYLGYKIDHAFEGYGLMTEALRQAIAYLFNEWDLHRIMANHMPHNHRSARLLFRLGFQVEGFAQHYLLINNKWEDHVLTALSYERWEEIRGLES